MRKTLPIALLAVLAGCGGSGTSTPNTFAGRYSGTYTGSGSAGTADFTVANNGAISGEFVNPGEGLTGTVTGSVTGAGAFSGNIRYTGGPTASLNGTLERLDATNYRSNFTQTLDGESQSFVATLTRR